MTSFEEFFSRFTSDSGGSGNGRAPFGMARDLFARSPLARIAAAGVVAVASGALVLTVFSGEKPVVVPGFLEARISAASPVDAKTHAIAHGTAVKLGKHSGYVLDQKAAKATLSLASVDAAKGGSWQRKTAGAVRRTTFGSETVVFGKNATGQYLTVEKKQGLKTWSWQLDSSLGYPRVGDDGYVAFIKNHAISQRIVIKPVKILDTTGRDITPAKLRWGVAETGAAKWQLQLRLNDAALPSSYVIDPIAFSTSTSGATSADVDGATGLTVANNLTGVAAGDTIIAVASLSGTPPSPVIKGTGASASALTFIKTATQAAAPRLSIAAKTADANDTTGTSTNFKLTWTTGTSLSAAMILTAFTGIQGTGFADITNDANNTSTPPSLTPNQDNELVIDAYSNANATAANNAFSGSNGSFSEPVSTGVKSSGGGTLNTGVDLLYRILGSDTAGVSQSGQAKTPTSSATPLALQASFRVADAAAPVVSNLQVATSTTLTFTLTDTVSGVADVVPPTSAFTINYTPDGGSLVNPTISSIAYGAQSSGARTVTLTTSSNPFSTAGTVTLSYTPPTATTLSGAWTATGTSMGVTSSAFGPASGKLFVSGSTSTGGGAHAPARWIVTYSANSAGTVTHTALGGTQPTVVVAAGSSISTALTDRMGNTVASFSNQAVTFNAPDGSGTMAAAPTSLSANSSGNTVTFTYTAPSGGLTNGAVEVTIPASWTAPSATSNGAGYTTSSTGTVGVAGQVITVTGVTLAGGATMTITYGDTTGGGAGVSTTNNPGTSPSFATRTKTLAGGTLTAIASSPTINLVALDGTGTVSLATPLNWSASRTGRTLTFTYTAGATGGLAAGEVNVVIPTGWSAPSITTSAAGYTTASTGTVAVTGQTIKVTGVTLAANGTFTITYGNTGSGGPGATIGSSTGSVTFTSTERSTSGTSGSGAALASITSPSGTVYAADGTGSIAVVAPTSYAASQTGRTVTFRYTAAAGDMSNGSVSVDIPSGWTAPQTGSSSTAGYVTVTGGGTPAVTGSGPWTITVTGVTLAANGTFDIVYGDTSGNASGAATITSTTGTATFAAKQASTGAGLLTTITSATATILAANGSGTLTVSPTSAVQDSTGKTFTFTYTAAAGGMSGGTITVLVPSGYTVPQTATDSGAGYVSSGLGTPSVTNNGDGTYTITVPNVTLAGGATGTIVYGDKTTNNGTGVTAAHTIQTDTFLAKQKSVAAGVLTTLASSPTVNITTSNQLPNVPTIVSPADTKFVNSTTPTFTANFTDPDSGDTGKLTFQVCSNNDCTSVLQTFDSTATNLAAAGANGSGTYSGGTALTNGTTYYWRVKGVDAVTASSAYSTILSFTVDTTAPTQTVTRTSVTGNSFKSGSTVYYNGANAGSLTIRSVVSDGGSGPASATFGNLGGTTTGFTFTGSTSTTPGSGTYDSGTLSWTGGTSSSPTVAVTGNDAAVPTGNTTSTVTLTFTNDITAPTSSFGAGVPAASSFLNSSTYSGSWAGTASDAGSDVQKVELSIKRNNDNQYWNGTAFASGTEVLATASGTTSWTFTAPTSSNLTDGVAYTIRVVATDNVGNVEGTNTRTFTYDTTAPGQTLSLQGATGAFLSGQTIYYKGDASGTFSIRSTITDSVAGPKQATFSAFSGSATGFTYAGASTDITSTYDSNTISWTTASTSPTLTVTAYDNADNTTTSPGTLTLTNDTSAPTGGSLTVNGGNAFRTTNTTISLARTPYTDAGSGLAAGTNKIKREVSALTNNTCPSFSDDNLDVTITAGADADTLLTGKCYRYTLTALDNVGNTVSTTFTVKIDTTAPSAPTFGLSATGTGVYYSGSGTTVYYKPGGSGTFTSDPSSTDAQTGIASYTNPDLTGWTGAGTSATSPRTYTLGAANTGATLTVVATNGAGATASTDVTVTADSTAPAGGTLIVNSGTAAASPSTTYNTSGTFTITGRNDYTDAGSNVTATGQLVRTSATLTNGNCGTFGSPTTITGSATQNAGAGISSGNCYQYTLTGTDNVGNTASISTIVKVDTSAPTLGTISLGSATNAAISGSSSPYTVYYKGNTTGSFTLSSPLSDTGGSGAASVAYPAIGTTGWTHALETVAGSTPYVSSTYSWTASPSNPANQTFTGSDNAGNTVTATVQFASDTTAPTSAFTFPVNNASYKNASPYTTSWSGTSSDGGSGVANVKISIYDVTADRYWNGSGWAGAGGAELLQSTGGTVNAWTYTGPVAATDLTTGHQYTVRIQGTDAVNNVETGNTITFSYDTSAPTITAAALSGATPSGNIFLSSLTGGGTSSATGTVFYKGDIGAGSPAGSFNLSVSSSDSNLQSASFPALGGTTGTWAHTAQTVTQGTSPFVSTNAFTWTGATETSSPTETVTVSDIAGNTATLGLTFTNDSTAPTGGSLTVNGGNAYRTADTVISLAKTPYTDAGSGLASGTNKIKREVANLSNNTCGGFSNDNLDVTITSGNDTDTLLSGKCYRYTLTGADNVGNTASSTFTVKIDTSAPAAPTAGLSASGTGVYYSGSGATVFFKPSGSGSFTLTGSSTDAETGIASYSNPDVSGWTGGGTSATNPRTYTLAAASTSTTLSETATNGAGTASSGTTVTITADSSVPSGGAITVNGGSAAASPTTTFNNTGSFTITGRSDYTDAGSGITATGQLVRTSATLSNGACGTFGSPTTITGSPAQNAGAGITTGNCYQYTLTGTDNVGNTSSISTVVAVDTTAPTSTTVTLSGGTTDKTFISGSTAYYNPATTGGSFVVTGTSTDAESGIASIAFPSAFSANWGVTGSGTSSGSTRTYTLNASDSTSGSQSITATNGAGGTATASFTLTPDSSGPTAGSLTVSPAGQTAATNVSLTVALGSDAGAGYQGWTIQRRFAAFSSGTTCGSFGSFADVTTGSTGGANSDTLPSTDGCYEYQLVEKDNVGNTTATAGSAQVKLNRSGLVLTGASPSSSAYQGAAGSVIYVKTGVSFSLKHDASGLSSVTYPAAATGSNTGFTVNASGSVSTSSSGFYVSPQAVGPTPTYTIGNTFAATSGSPAVITALANGSTSAPVSIVLDTTAPSVTQGSGTVSPNPRNTGASFSVSASDGDSGVSDIYYTTDGSTPSFTCVVGGTGTANSPTVKISGSSGSVSIPATQGSYTPKIIAVDHLCNASSTTTGTTVVVDTTAPADSVTVSSATPALNGQPAAFKSGTTVFYRGTSTGTPSLTLTNAPTDSGGAAVASATFGSLSGTSTGFTFTGSTDLTSTYDSNALQWTTGTTSSPTVLVNSTDTAGNSSTGVSLTLTNDSTLPTISATTVTTPRNSAASITVTGDDGSGSGIAAVCYTTNGSTPATATGGATTCTTGATATISLSADGSYTLKYLAVDNVGNASTVTTGQTVVIDTAGPTGTAITAPTVGPVSGTAVTVTGTGTDTGSGLASLTLAYRITGGTGSWTSIGSSSSTSPVTGTWNTSNLVNGNYDLRITATDAAGNVTQTVATIAVSNPARTLVSSSIDSSGTSLAMTFSGPLDTTSLPPLSPTGAFTVLVGGVSRTVSGISISGSIVTLTLSPAVQAADTSVTVAYPTITTPPLKDARGNNIAIFTAQPVTNGSTQGVVVTPTGDTTPPSPTAAAANGPIVTIDFDEDLVGTPALSAFQLTGSLSGARAPSSISVSGKRITLTFASPVQAGESLKVGYANSTNLKDGANNAVQPFTIDVANNTVAFAGSAGGNVGNIGGTTAGGTGGGNAFTLTGAYVNSNTVTLTFNRVLGGPDLVLNAFRVIGSTTGSRAPIALAKSGSTLTLTLAAPALSGETVLVTYTRPTSGGIEDTQGNSAVPFAGALATNTTVGIPVPPPAATAPPAIQTISPNDGLTIPAVNQIDILATKEVTWSNLSVTLPNGTVRALEGGTGISITRAFPTTTVGPYTITGEMQTATSAVVSFISHFTIFTPPPPIVGGNGSSGGTAGISTTTTLDDAPPVSRVSEANQPGAIVASNGVASMQWPQSAFPQKTVVKVDPVPVTLNAEAIPTTTPQSQGKDSTSVAAVFAAGGQAVQVTATTDANGTPVRTFAQPLEIEFPNAPIGSVPSVSEDGRNWRPIKQMPAGATTITCPGDVDGWYRDATGSTHILSCHLTYFGVLIQPAAAPLVALVAVAPRPYLGARKTFGFLVRTTQPSTVSAVLRQGNSTLMRWPAREVKPGSIILKRKLPRRSLAGHTAFLEVVIRAGKGRVRMVKKVQFLTAAPTAPARPIVLLVNGLDSRRTLSAALKKSYQLAYFTTSPDSYRMISDPKRNITAVVVDLGSSPIQHSIRIALIRNLRYLFPQLRIVVATNQKKLRGEVLKAGAERIVASPPTPVGVSAALNSLFRKS